MRSVPGDGGQRSRGGRVHYLARGGAGSHLRTRMDGRRRGGIPLSATADRFHPAAGSFKDTWLCSCGGPSRPFPVPLRGCGFKGLLLRWPRQPCETRLRHRQPSSPQTPRPTGDCAPLPLPWLRAKGARRALGRRIRQEAAASSWASLALAAPSCTYLLDNGGCSHKIRVNEC